METISSIHDDILAEVEEGNNYTPIYGDLFNDSLIFYLTEGSEAIDEINRDERLYAVLENIFSVYSELVDVTLYIGIDLHLTSRQVGNILEINRYSLCTTNYDTALKYAGPRGVVLMLNEPVKVLSVGNEELVLPPIRLKVMKMVRPGLFDVSSLE